MVEVVANTVIAKIVRLLVASENYVFGHWDIQLLGAAFI